VSEWAEGARYALAGIFVVSAVAKVARRGGPGPQDALALGVPAPLAPVVGVALPAFEGILAVLLIAVPARWPSVVALVFLVGVTLLIVRALARGVRTPCRCFGGLSARPLSGRAVLRNLALIGLAAAAVAVPAGLGAPGWTALVLFVAAFGLVLIG
jgi:hypothetical protein